MRVLIFFIVLTLSQNSFSVGMANLYEVDFVRADKSGKGYVRFKTDLSSSPALCIQPGYESSLAFNTNEAGGKAILSLVLSAQASGRKIRANGTGACGIYGVMEDWTWGYIK